MDKQNFSQKVIELLKEKKAVKCPVCGSEDTGIFDGIFARAMKDTTALPCAVVVCQNCGFIREHAVAPLGIKIVTK